MGHSGSLCIMNFQVVPDRPTPQEKNALEYEAHAERDPSIQHPTFENEKGEYSLSLISPTTYKIDVLNLRTNLTALWYL